MEKLETHGEQREVEGCIQGYKAGPKRKPVANRLGRLRGEVAETKIQERVGC